MIKLGLDFLIRRVDLQVTILILFVSCGGGGGSSNSVSQNPSSNESQSSASSQSIIPSLPISMSSDYSSFNQRVDDIKNVYGELPLGINLDPIWYKSLSYPSSEIITPNATSYDLEEPMYNGVGYGNFLNISSEKTLIFQSFWKHDRPSSGGLYVLEINQGRLGKLHSKNTEGSVHVNILKNGDGSISVISPGHDEGKLWDGDDFGGYAAPPDAPSFKFNLENNTWEDIGITTAAHGSAVFDYQNDGDDDLALSHAAELCNKSAVIIINENGNFSHKCIGTLPSTMFLAPFYDDSNRLGFVVTDAIGGGDFYDDVTDGSNILVFFDENNFERPLEVKILPDPYFEKDDYSQINTVIEDWEAGTSHDVFAEVIDIDYDGDKDIVIGSTIWSHDRPYGVMQLLINKDGIYSDETDNRLFNWVLPSGHTHKIDFIDINGDGFKDILVSSHGNAFHRVDGLRTNGLGGASRVLINDGTGHFVVVAHELIHADKEYGTTFIPSISSYDNKLRFIRIDSRGYTNPGNRAFTEEIKFNYPFSTGPNNRDPSQWNEPEFNEFFYILNNQEVQDALSSGKYSSGLAHYIREGKELGLKINAK